MDLITAEHDTALDPVHFYLSLRALLRQPFGRLPSARSGQAGHGLGQAPGRSNLLPPLSLRAFLRQPFGRLPSARSGQAGHGSGQAPGRSNLLPPAVIASPPSTTLRQAPLGTLGTGRTWLGTGSGAKQSPPPAVIASPTGAKQSPLLHVMRLLKVRSDLINQKFALLLVLAMTIWRRVPNNDRWGSGVIA
jgi:hypothetical protein